jgi:hypothetical protein
MRTFFKKVNNKLSNKSSDRARKNNQKAAKRRNTA